MTEVSLRKLAKSIIPPKSALRKEVRDGFTILWDEYNSTYEGTQSALEAFENIKSKNPKICIFSGIFELGPIKSEVYEEVSKKMSEVCNKIFCTSEDGYYNLEKTHNPSIQHKIILDMKGEKLSKYLAKTKADILIEGKLFSSWVNPFHK